MSSTCRTPQGGSFYSSGPRDRANAGRGRGLYSTPRGRRAGEQLLPAHHLTPPDTGHYQPRQGLLDTSGLSPPPGYDDSSCSDAENGGQLPLTGSSRFNCSRPSVRTTSPTPFQCTSGDVVTLLQQQQALLQRVLSQQDVMQQKQREFDGKLAGIEDKLSNMTERSTTSESSSEKQKIRVPRELTMKVSSIHDSLDEGFDPSTSSVCIDNKRVKQLIVSQINKSPDCKYTLQQIKAAVQRKYESLRRDLLRDGRDDRQQVELVESRKKKYRSRRQRKFCNRATVVQLNEKKYWEQLSLEYMTEESDDPSDAAVIIEHRFPWRSQRLCDFLSILDKRYEIKAKSDKGQMAKKVRKQGTLSLTPPPVDAPPWTVDPSYQDALEDEDGTQSTTGQE